MSAKVAAREALRCPVQDGMPVTDTVQGREISPHEGDRRLVYALDQTDGSVDDALLYTTLPRLDGDSARLFALSNERTTIEAFFAPSRHVHNIQNRRSRKFHAIAAFLPFVALTHNLLVWVKHTRLGHSPLATATPSQLVGDAARVRAHVYGDGQWHVRLIGSSRWAALLLDALQPAAFPVQLRLPFARLHKT